MIMEMFVYRILNLMQSKLTSHARYEFLEIEANAQNAINTYEAVVMGKIL